MSNNEEKLSKYFVWERRQHDGEPVPAIYRGKPLTGAGTEFDNNRFVTLVLLPPEDEYATIKELEAKYPKPSRE